VRNVGSDLLAALLGLLQFDLRREPMQFRLPPLALEFFDGPPAPRRLGTIVVRGLPRWGQRRLRSGQRGFGLPLRPPQGEAGGFHQVK
jgi:hypothetical protein